MSDARLPETSPPPPLPWAVAGSASLGAALIHGAAAGSHADDRQLALLFAVAAIAQAAWGIWALGRRASRTTALTGILLHGLALGTLVVARTTGIAFIDGLAEPSEVGVQDGLVAVLEAVALIAAALLSVRPTFAPPRRGIAPALAAAALLLAAVPAMATPHPHGRGEAGEPHGDGVAAGHLHDDSGHDDHHGSGSATPTAEVVVADVIALPSVAGITAEQEARARDLIHRTRTGLARFADPAAAEAAGFRSIGDGFTGVEHFVHYDYLANATILDANEPESLVYKVQADGTRQLASAMYILPTGTTMDDVPDVAGAMTPWHDHRNLCWSPDGRLAGLFVNGKCTAGEHRITPPMLHVWVIDHVCGPFAGIEGGSIPTTPEECPAHGH